MSLFPGRSELLGKSTYAGVRGERVEPNTPARQGVSDGTEAREERVEAARRAWPERHPEDFVWEGAVFTEVATGRTFHQVKGAPWLSVGTPAAASVSCFYVDSGRLWFLADDAVPEGTVVHHGAVRGQEVAPTFRPAAPEIY